MKCLKIISIFILIMILLNAILPIISSATNQQIDENTITNKINTLSETEFQEQSQTSSDKYIEEKNDEINKSGENIILEESEKASTDEEVFKNINVEDLSVAYSTYIQDIGWQEAVIDGDTSGTTGESKRIEAIKVKLFNAPSNAKIKYEVYMENEGWKDSALDGEIAGSINENLKMYGIKIALENMTEYSVQYRVHLQDLGWQEWKKDGEEAGKLSEQKRIEAIEIKLIKNNKIENETKDETDNETENQLKNEVEETKGEMENESDKTKEVIENNANSNEVKGKSKIETESLVENTNILKASRAATNSSSISVVYDSHVQDYGWEKSFSKSNGQTSGTTGQSKKIEAVRIKLVNAPQGTNIKYTTYIDGMGWQGCVSNGATSGTTGQNKRMYGIRIQLENSSEYSVKYRVHMQDIGWGDWFYDGDIAGELEKQKRIEAIEIQLIPKREQKLSVSYKAHVQDIGWQKATKDGGTAGTTGQSKKIEAINIKLSGAPIEGKINYCTYIDGIGWQSWRKDGFTSGTTGQNKKIYGIKIQLVNMDNYSVEYRVHIQEEGWTAWKKDGEIAGNIDEKLRIEAIQIKLVARKTHVQYYSYVNGKGWEGAYSLSDGGTSGTTGQSKKLEGIKIRLQNAPSNAHITYRTHVQDIGWTDYVKDGTTTGVIGQGKKIEAIQVQLQGLDDYTVEYRVHVQDIGWTNWYIDNEVAGTVGQNKRIEAIQIRIVPKYKRQYKGIDVSEWNGGTINWYQVKASGVDFVMIRIGYRGYGAAGNFAEDPYFKINMQGAKAAGLKVGVYFFTQAINTAEAKEEAVWVLNKLKEYKYTIELPIAIDTESSGEENGNGRADHLDVATRTAVCKTFAETIKANGYIPMIYASKNWFYNNLDMSQLLQYDTWLAHYTDETDYKYHYEIWQYSSSGSVLGILGRTDLNYGYKKYW